MKTSKSELKEFSGTEKDFKKKYLPKIALFVLFAFLNLVIGCHYYKVMKVPVDSMDQETLNPQRYVILHLGGDAWHFSSLELDQDKNELRGRIMPLASNHENFRSNNPDKPNRYKVANPSPINELHIYTKEYQVFDSLNVVVPLTAVSKIELYDKDMATTTFTYVFTTIGILLTAFVIFLILLFIFKSSCPFVYTFDGQSYTFMGEIYGGSIYSSLERDDYMPLPGFQPAGGKFTVKISNELLERQYTNLAQLIVVEHPEVTEVLMDKGGNVQTITSAVTPFSASSELETDYTGALAARDFGYYLFNDQNSDVREQNALIMSFKKPENAESGKLILNAKNSLWLDYIYGEFTKLFGTAYNRFAEKQKQIPAEKNIQWMQDQGLVLSVYLETENGWQFVDYFDMVGPMAARDLVMPVDLSDVKSENVRMKLTCGQMFWELDYAAMDFTENIPVKIHYLDPATAVDEKGRDVTKLLLDTDNLYLEQPEVGNEAVITWPEIKLTEGQDFTAFLHSRGYYEHIRDYKTKPDIAYLKSFYEKGAFNEFSRQHYNRILNSNALLVKQTGDDN
ncbi:MAG: hypothetical protein K0B15_01660 [Lentimicrobium sp.]|nr:hypothetical protein [Lentimicrobium sp.]